MPFDWQAALIAPLRAALTKIIEFIPPLLGGLLILLIGWIVARIARATVARILLALRVDRLAMRTEAGHFLTKGDMRYFLSDLIAALAYGIVLLLFLDLALREMHLAGIAAFVDAILRYIPKIFTAAAVMVVALAISAFLGGAVRVAAGSVGVPQGGIIGRIVQYAVLIMALTVAFEQMGLATQILTSTVQVAVGALAFGFALAFGIAFGLGCKDIVRDVVSGAIRRGRPTE